MLWTPAGPLTSPPPVRFGGHLIRLAFGYEREQKTQERSDERPMENCGGQLGNHGASLHRALSPRYVYSLESAEPLSASTAHMRTSSG
jgi:hypothetical protein